MQINGFQDGGLPAHGTHMSILLGTDPSPAIRNKRHGQLE
jgi:hypothetical protein